MANTSSLREKLLSRLRERGITDPDVLSNIMAQAEAESGSGLEENLGRYTAKNLFDLYGPNQSNNKVRFKTIEEAKEVVEAGPEAVGDIIYGDKSGRKGTRGDLGNDMPGEGNKYRGRGLFMQTGKNNYRRVSRSVYGDDRLVENPDLLSDPDVALDVAEWYATKNAHKFTDPVSATKQMSPATTGATSKRAELARKYKQKILPETNRMDSVYRKLEEETKRGQTLEDKLLSGRYAVEPIEVDDTVERKELALDRLKKEAALDELKQESAQEQDMAELGDLASRLRGDGNQDIGSANMSTESDDDLARRIAERALSNTEEKRRKQEQDLVSEIAMPDDSSLFPGGLRSGFDTEKKSDSIADKMAAGAEAGGADTKPETPAPDTAEVPTTPTEEVAAGGAEAPEQAGPPASAALSQDERLAYQDLVQELTPKEALSQLADAYRKKREGKQAAGRAQALFTLADALVKLGAASRGVDLTSKKGPEIYKNLEAGIEQTFQEESAQIKKGLARGQASAAEKYRELLKQEKEASDLQDKRANAVIRRAYKDSQKNVTKSQSVIKTADKYLAHLDSTSTSLTDNLENAEAGIKKFREAAANLGIPDQVAEAVIEKADDNAYFGYDAGTLREFIVQFKKPYADTVEYWRQMNTLADESADARLAGRRDLQPARFIIGGQEVLLMVTPERYKKLEEAGYVVSETDNSENK